MTCTSHKHRADNEPASSPPAKRSRSEKQTPSPTPTSPTSSPPRRTPSPAIYQPSTPTTPSVSASLDEAPPDQDTDPLLSRIQSGITYTLSCHRLNTVPAQTTRFYIPTTTTTSTTTSKRIPTPALTLPHTHATPIASSPSFSIYELGIPRPDWVSQWVLPGIHDPQWWVGKSVAEVKAGPWADEGEVKRAEGVVRGAEARRNGGKKGVARVKGKGEREREEKLREGVRRQEPGERM